MIYNEQNQQMEMTPTESQDKAVETLVFKLQEAIQDKETYNCSSMRNSKMREIPDIKLTEFQNLKEAILAVFG